MSPPIFQNYFLINISPKKMKIFYVSVVEWNATSTKAGFYFSLLRILWSKFSRYSWREKNFTKIKMIHKTYYLIYLCFNSLLRGQCYKINFAYTMKQHLNAKILIISSLLTLRNWLSSFFSKYASVHEYVKVKMCWLMHRCYQPINTFKSARAFHFLS